MKQFIITFVFFVYNSENSFKNFHYSCKSSFKKWKNLTKSEFNKNPISGQYY